MRWPWGRFGPPLSRRCHVTVTPLPAAVCAAARAPSQLLNKTKKKLRSSLPPLGTGPATARIVTSFVTWYSGWDGRFLLSPSGFADDGFQCSDDAKKQHTCLTPARWDEIVAFATKCKGFDINGDLGLILTARCPCAVSVCCVRVLCPCAVSVSISPQSARASTSLTHR